METYHFSKIINYDFESAITRVTEVLAEYGFGVMSDIDVKATLKKKLDVEFRKYRILGACHPQSAYKALTFENKIGTMLPCNVIVQEHIDGSVEVSAINPIASMTAVENADLGEVALEITQKLKSVIDKI